MARTVPEWIADHDDQAIPRLVKARIWARYNGCCAKTGRKLRAGDAHQFDHIVPLINGDRDDNRIENLRDVTGAENARNRRLQADNATGRTGVTAYPFQGQLRFVARIRVGGKLHHLGYFATVEEAAEARRAAEIKHGFHINHGSRPKTRTPLKGRGFEKSRRFPALTSSEVE